MGLTSAMYSGLSGLDANSMQFEVIGNNIANVNTTGYKARRVLFQTQFSRTLSIGSGAGGNSGGSNPMQIGLGEKPGAIDTDFTMGSVQTTGINSDLAIEGNGFFVLRNQQNQDVYSRNGAFTVNNQGNLVDSKGDFVQGYGISQNFTLIPGNVTDLSIPLGFMTVTQPTNNAEIQGNLNSDGDVATQGSILDSMAMVDNAGNPVTAATLLTNVRAASAPAVPLFALGDDVDFNSKRGNRDLPAATLTVGAGTTLGDLAATMQTAMGIDSDPTLPIPGSVAVVGGVLEVSGDSGEQNDISLDINSININGTSTPFTWTSAQAATGESAYTSYTIYDSHGTPMQMDLTFVKESISATGTTTWRFYADSSNNTGGLLLGNGTIQFDTSGKYVSATGATVNVDLTGTGAATPQPVSLDFSTLTSDADSKNGSQLALSYQDGVPLGTLSGFGVADDGIITGTFTNGLTRTLGQVALATFANPNGLLDVGDSAYAVGPNSGVAVVDAPEKMSAGSLQAGALELSNVDLSKEFVNLITTSTGFSANSRVITTANQMLMDVLQMGR